VDTCAGKDRPRQCVGRDVTTRISDTRTLAVPPRAVFAFLASGRNHHKLTGRSIQLLELCDGADPDFRAVMVIHGPLGIRRWALTRIDSSSEPELISGTANLGPRTAVRLRWELRAIGRRSTLVVLRATVSSSSFLDRLLLRLGGAAWMRRLFTSTLELLAAQAGDVADAHRREVLPT
jgi:Polyketide cyclase / dehydrase and lipid transport